ncbi:conserved hypothetical protein [Ricinus communis]|uniref:Uncharacterized protein n=1 Tax=Ricinus communis TaxID=3988 RepID=B9TEK9_RICCO|nr:conserved hypothetical protein [Ricinus communis]
MAIGPGGPAWCSVLASRKSGHKSGGAFSLRRHGTGRGYTGPERRIWRAADAHAGSAALSDLPRAIRTADDGGQGPFLDQLRSALGQSTKSSWAVGA